MNKLILAIILIVMCSISAVAQPSNLTERELLVQLYEKVETIERMVNSISNNTYDIQRDVALLDKRVSKNEMSVTSFCEKLDNISKSWYWLLGLFFTFVTGIFFIIWRKFWNGNDKKVNI